jgi:hypothetical protein
MRTIRPHTREERLALVEALVPRIHGWFGDRLVALATCASVARGDDRAYSDLELLAIVTDGPPGGRGVLHDGMLIELEWMTETDYVARACDVGEEWYLAGAGALAPVLDEALIERLSARVPDDLEGRCRRRARSQWFEVQEATAKVLNAVDAGNRDAVGLVAWDMLRHMLIALAFLNAAPYLTFASMITQARSLPLRPAALADLLDLMVAGGFGGLDRLRELVVTVVEQLEKIYDEQGVPLGVEGLDALAPA